MTQEHDRVVITGMGWVTPLGHDLSSTWKKIMETRSGVNHITHFDARNFPTSFAAEVQECDLADFLEDPEPYAEVGRHTLFALCAAAGAWKQSGLYENTICPTRIGAYLGGGEGVLDFAGVSRAHLAGWQDEEQVLDTRLWAEAARASLTSRYEVEQEPNMPLAHLARAFSINGPTFNCLTACAASTQAIGEACNILRNGEADVMLAGGTHSMIHELGMTGFNRLTALSTHRESPQEASRPFSRNRDGFVMGEGAGMLVLESLKHASARGARPLAELTGFGSTADAYRITDMHPEGMMAAQAIRSALGEAGIAPDATGDDGRPRIDYISAHGTGTAENDAIETLAVKAVFGDLAPRIPISSIKSMMGHLIAAAGAVELITCVLAITHQVLPPTINLHEPDPELDLDYIPNTPRAARIDTCLSNSFGFGGQNDTIVVERYTG